MTTAWTGWTHDRGNGRREASGTQARRQAERGPRHDPECDGKDLRVPGDKEIELKFQVPTNSRAALLAELCRGRLPVERTTLAAQYLDTPDRRLARKGLAWRLRREGRRWVQTLKTAGASPLERFEHEVVIAAPSHDAARHAGTPAGEQLLHVLRRVRKDGGDVGVRFLTRVSRTSRRLRTRGAVVEVSFDEGRLTAGDRGQRIHEVEFELVSGSPLAMIGLAERWRRQFNLVYDPRSKAERGDQLAEGSPQPPLRKALAPSYARHAYALQAFVAVLDECLAQVSRNAIGLFDGDVDQRVEHVHQMRVGIRRLRSALRCFEAWVPAPPAELVEKLHAVFETLGQVREADVLGSGVVADLARAGAPPIALPTGASGPDPAAVVRSAQTQQMLLAWIGWRASLANAGREAAGTGEAVADAASPAPASSDAAPAEPSTTGSAPAGATAADGASTAAAAPGHAPLIKLGDDPREFRHSVQKRLRRWHQGLADDCARFDDLDEIELHSLRKRIKRQRYAVEFFAPVLCGKAVQRYLDALAVIQDRMGELNDLFVARDQYRSLLPQEPGAWFALGWLSARTQEVLSLARPELQRAVQVDPPRARG
jgi:inorganic triphosphatase YgiF